MPRVLDALKESKVRHALTVWRPDGLTGAHTRV